MGLRGASKAFLTGMIHLDRSLQISVTKAKLWAICGRRSTTTALIPSARFVARVEHLMRDVVTLQWPEPSGSWDSLGS
jgi:hypothetical protein